ncbi:MAG: dihydroorotate dehydrogenase electron transfer subunit [Planctomycetes bacterium]|nr:dihydroorotate dehydrogenase electron transfer subunit [Planctomycetota bacterium]
MTLVGAPGVPPADLPGRVLALDPLGSEAFRLRLHVPGLGGEPAPGVFFQVLCREEEARDPLVRRPFSVADARAVRDGVEVDLIFAVVGRGTAWLASRRTGDTVRLLGPLGRPFAPGPGGLRRVVVAGGLGVAPFPLLVRTLRGRQASPDPVTVLLGARTARRVLCAREFEAAGARVRVATDDGTAGTRGQVTALLEEELDPGLGPAEVHACGPEPMLRRVVDLCAEAGVACQVSLERVMACGFGACYGCVVRARPASGGPPRHDRSCLGGPVYDAARLAGVEW